MRVALLLLVIGAIYGAAIYVLSVLIGLIDDREQRRREAKRLRDSTVRDLSRHCSSKVTGVTSGVR